MFVRGKPFQSSLTFVSNAGAYPSGAPERSYPIGWAMDLPTNVRLGWKHFPKKLMLLATS